MAEVTGRIGLLIASHLRSGGSGPTIGSSAAASAAAADMARVTRVATPEEIAEALQRDEAALLAQVYERLTTPSSDMDVLPSEVAAAFRHYSRIGNKLSAGTLSHANARKWARDAGLLSYRSAPAAAGSSPAASPGLCLTSAAAVDMLYTRVVRGDAARYGILHMVGEDKGLTPDVTWPWFLARVGLWRWMEGEPPVAPARSAAATGSEAAAGVAEHGATEARGASNTLAPPGSPSRKPQHHQSQVHPPSSGSPVRHRGLPSPSHVRSPFTPASTSPVKVSTVTRTGSSPAPHTTSPPRVGAPVRSVLKGGTLAGAVERVLDIVRDFLESCERQYDTGEVEALLEPDCIDALRRADGVLQRIFYAYTYGRDSAITALDWSTLAKLAAEFTVCPGIVSKPTLFAIFLAVSPSQTPLLYPGFLEFMGRTALSGFRSPSLIASHPTAASAVDALMDRILSAADRLATLAAAEKRRGFSAAAAGKLVGRASFASVGGGDGSTSARRVSTANLATVQTARGLSSSALEFLPPQEGGKDTERAGSVSDEASVQRIARRRNTAVTTAALTARGEDLYASAASGGTGTGGGGATTGRSVSAGSASARLSLSAARASLRQGVGGSASPLLSAFGGSAGFATATTATATPGTGTGTGGALSARGVIGIAEIAEVDNEDVESGAAASGPGSGSKSGVPPLWSQPRPVNTSSTGTGIGFGTGAVNASPLRRSLAASASVGGIASGAVDASPARMSLSPGETHKAGFATGTRRLSSAGAMSKLNKAAILDAQGMVSAVTSPGGSGSRSPVGMSINATTTTGAAGTTTSLPGAVGSPTPLTSPGGTSTTNTARERRATGVAVPLFSSRSLSTSRTPMRTVSEDGDGDDDARDGNLSMQRAAASGFGYHLPGTGLAGTLARSQLALATSGKAVPIPMPAAAALAASVSAAREGLVPTGHTALPTSHLARASVTARNRLVAFDPAASAALAIAEAAGASHITPSLAAGTTDAVAGAGFMSRHLDALCAEFAPLIPKLRPIFLFYARIGDAGNTGRLSITNFFRLLRDIDALDDVVTTGAVHLQLAALAQSAAAHAHPSAEPSATTTAAGATARTGSPPRGTSPAGVPHASVPTLEAVGLSLDGFFEALARVSELIRRSLDANEDTATSGEAWEEWPRARSGFEHLLTRRVLPLVGLSDAEEQCNAVLESPAVQAVLDEASPLLQRLFSYYANDQRDGSGIAIFLPEFLAFAKEFEVWPSLLSRGDVESVFFATARHAGTDLGKSGLAGHAGASGVGGAVGPRRTDAAYNYDAATRRSALFNPYDRSPGRPGKRTGKGGGARTETLSAAYRAPDSAFLRYPAFTAAVGRFAIVGFSRPFLVERFGEPEDKVRGLLDWILASRAVDVLEASDWTRGRSRRGRRLNRKQLFGGGITVAKIKEHGVGVFEDTAPRHDESHAHSHSHSPGHSARHAADSHRGGRSRDMIEPEDHYHSADASLRHTWTSVTETKTGEGEVPSHGAHTTGTGSHATHTTGASTHATGTGSTDGSGLPPPPPPAAYRSLSPRTGSMIAAAAMAQAGTTTTAGTESGSTSVSDARATAGSTAGGMSSFEQWRGLYTATANAHDGLSLTAQRNILQDRIATARESARGSSRDGALYESHARASASPSSPRQPPPAPPRTHTDAAHAPSPPASPHAQATHTHHHHGHAHGHGHGHHGVGGAAATESAAFVPPTPSHDHYAYTSGSGEHFTDSRGARATAHHAHAADVAAADEAGAADSYELPESSGMGTGDVNVDYASGYQAAASAVSEAVTHERDSEGVRPVDALIREHAPYTHALQYTDADASSASGAVGGYGTRQHHEHVDHAYTGYTDTELASALASGATHSLVDTHYVDYGATADASSSTSAGVSVGAVPQSTTVEVDYVVASVRVGDFGSGAPSKRYLRALQAAGSTMPPLPADAASHSHERRGSGSGNIAPPLPGSVGAAAADSKKQALFHPGEVQFLARQTAARTEALADHAARALRATADRSDVEAAGASTLHVPLAPGAFARAAAASPVSLASGVMYGTTNAGRTRHDLMPFAYAATDGMPGPDDPALAAWHRTEFVRCVADKYSERPGGLTHGGPATAPDRRAHSAPRLHTEARARLRLQRAEYQAAVTRFQDAYTAAHGRRSSLSTLHQLEQLMGQHSAHAPHAQHGQPEFVRAHTPSTSSIAARAGNAAVPPPVHTAPPPAHTASQVHTPTSSGSRQLRAAGSPRVTAAEADPLMVVLPDGTRARLTSLRSPLARTVMDGWSGSLRSPRTYAAAASAAAAGGSPRGGGTGTGTGTTPAKASTAKASSNTSSGAGTGTGPTRAGASPSLAAAGARGRRTSWLTQLKADVMSTPQAATGTETGAAATATAPTTHSMSGASASGDGAVSGSVPRTLVSTHSFRGVASPAAAALVPPRTLPGLAATVATWHAT